MMPLDLKIMTVRPGVPIAANTWPDAQYVDGEYGLVQKIAKCLYTRRGTDAFDPEYGTLLQKALEGLSSDDDSLVHQAAADAAKAVFDQLAPATLNAPDPASRLLSISVLRTGFNSTTAGWDIDLAVTTGAGTLSVTL
jgi:phage baseplate assembly protein W